MATMMHTFRHPPDAEWCDSVTLFGTSAQEFYFGRRSNPLSLGAADGRILAEILASPAEPQMLAWLAYFSPLVPECTVWPMVFGRPCT